MGAKRVLIVDDEPHLCTVVQACLENLGGWEVIVANSGVAGLQQAEAAAIDVILLDVMMPDLDGTKLFQRLRENPKTQQIPVIFLTAKAQRSDQHQLEQLGIAGVITKPFDPMTLTSQIAAILGWE